MRKSNIELLRVISMVFIVIHHIIVHILGLKTLETDSYDGEPILVVVNSLLVIGVNLFVLISGYFSIKLKWENILNLFFTVFFYVSLDFLFCKFFNVPHSQKYISAFLLGHWTNYWFIQTYVILCLTSPILNRAINSMNNKEYVHNVALLVIANCFFGFVLGNNISTNGYQYFHFVTLYFIGGLLHRSAVLFDNYPITRNYLAYGYGVICAMIGVLCYVLYKMGEQGQVWRIFSYNDPLIILSSVMFFYMFVKLRMSSNIVINAVASSVLAIYLCQEGIFGRYIYASFDDLFGISWTSLTLYAIVIFSMPLAIDQIRKSIFNRICKYIQSISTTAPTV